MESREQQLLRIAGKMFGSIGFERTSLRQIAEEAGITKAALYYYFPDKQTLYDRVVLDALKRLTAYVEERVSVETLPEEQLRAFVLAMAQYMELERDSWLAGSNTFWADQDRDRRERAITTRDQFEQRLRAIITELVKTGSWRPIDPRVATHMLLGAINQIPRWHKPDGRLTVVEVVRQYLDIFMNSVKADH